MKNANANVKFQSDLAGVVNEAARSDVHPAVVYTVLCGIAQDVLYSIKQSARMADQAAKEKDVAAAAETVLKTKPKTEEPNNAAQLHQPGPVDGPGNH